MAAPKVEFEVDSRLVVALLEEQHPDLAHLAVRPVGSGWDNAIFRLGDSLVARLPQRESAVALLRNELKWLPLIGPGLPLPVPLPLRKGVAGCGYPWPWSVGPWLPGETAEASPPVDPEAAAETLGGFLAAMHRPAPADAPTNPFRGVPLADRDRQLRQELPALEGVVDTDEVLARWNEALETPPWAGAPTWLHGDVHPLNLLVHRGRLSSVIDFGDICAGDPASDLSVAWMMLDGEARNGFRRAAGTERPVDDDTWRRAWGWALALGVALAHGDERVSAFGLRTLKNALRDGTTPLRGG